MLSWLLAFALAAECVLDVPPDTPFAVQAPHSASHVRVLVELWAKKNDGAWVDGLLDVLEARDLSGAVILPLPGADGTEPEFLDLAARAAAGGHERLVAGVGARACRIRSADVPGRTRAGRRCSAAAQTREVGELPFVARDAFARDFFAFFFCAAFLVAWVLRALGFAAAPRRSLAAFSRLSKHSDAQARRNSGSGSIRRQAVKEKTMSPL